MGNLIFFDLSLDFDQKAIFGSVFSFLVWHYEVCDVCIDYLMVTFGK